LFRDHLVNKLEAIKIINKKIGRKDFYNNAITIDINFAKELKTAHKNLQDALADGSSQKIGDAAEKLAINFYSTMGYVVKAPKHGSNKGIDLVVWRGAAQLKNATEWYIVDAKSFTAKILLNETESIGTLMEDEWIRKNAVLFKNSCQQSDKDFAEQLVKKVQSNPIPKLITAIDKKVGADLLLFLKIEF
jgi:hypothetical protein